MSIDNYPPGVTTKDIDIRFGDEEITYEHDYEQDRDEVYFAERVEKVSKEQRQQRKQEIQGILELLQACLQEEGYEIPTRQYADFGYQSFEIPLRNGVTKTEKLTIKIEFTNWD